MISLTNAQSLTGVGACELRGRLARGEVSAGSVADACLAAIERREPQLQAWAWLDPEHVRAQATRLDAWRESGRPIGALHGVPVALKDIIDTAGIPTEYGCAVTSGHVPEADAVLVKTLKRSGALIMGKTVTTELAFMHPGPTRNPRNPGHTPGGSSSGSAAAVASGMVPLAIGTQTGGSVIRPAAYCGIVGFKPTFGTIPREGVLTQSPSLDTVGVFARSVEDAALLAAVLAGSDAPRDDLLAAVSLEITAPRLAFVDLPGVAPEIQTETALLAEALAVRTGAELRRERLPDSFATASAQREVINFAEMARHYRWLAERGADRLSEETRAAMRSGEAALACDYIAALEAVDALYRDLETLFGRYDAILSAATPGRAPNGLASTGSAICNGLWTLCRTPSITVPLRDSVREGLPLGLQIAAPRDRDARLLGIARGLSEPGAEACWGAPQGHC